MYHLYIFQVLKLTRKLKRFTLLLSDVFVECHWTKWIQKLKNIKQFFSSCVKFFKGKNDRVGAKKKSPGNLSAVFTQNQI